MSEGAGARRIACVHEWLTDWGGSEDCLRLILAAYPQARAYATIDFLSPADRIRLGRGKDISTTFLQRAPWIATRFWNYLPVTALAVETHDVGDAQMIISSSHAFAKGVLTRADQFHLSYVYSPMRYAWDLHQQYLRDYGLDRGVKSLLARYLFHRLRRWDRQTANNVDLFIAISKHVRDRIWRCYRRPALVVYPPVRTHLYSVQAQKEDHYVTVSRLVSYKRIDIIVEAFRAMPSRKLLVVGDGPEMARLRARCPPNVTLLGRLPDEAVRDHLKAARAFLFAAHEDFGISPVEAQACGTPVIAYGAGGSLETVRGLGRSERPTGLFFPEQTAASIVQAVEAFEAAGPVFDPAACREWAEGFSEERFSREFSECAERGWAHWQRDPRGVDNLAADPSSRD
ncbi:MAG: glycosyltransferase family 4 protein [Ramlibacter sp.]|nr:glycosyltransferase family 4 protein [Ramlibacter sp.]